MSIVPNVAVRNAVIESLDPHCVAWGRATASLWGMSREHDLDIPVRLSDEVPVRLRYKGRHLVTDRDFSLKVERSASAAHAAVRFYFKDGTFREADLTLGVPNIAPDEIVTVTHLGAK
jgi:hypothetical protein